MPDDSSQTTLERIISERREKAAALRRNGAQPYRNDVCPTVCLDDVRHHYVADKPRVDGVSLRVAGRVLSKRTLGKGLVFAVIRDATGDVQLLISARTLDHDDFANVLPQLDAGDIVLAEGPAMWTKTDELSIQAWRLWIVTKALRPLPDKWHGLTDLEQRYRRRYVDLAISPEVRSVFRKRSRIVQGVRRFLDDRDFLEVETPLLHTIAGGAAARPFTTHHNALDMELYMRVAPELFLKRLLVGGFDRVYEIGRNFRNEGLSRRHNPEFTMLEFYQAYATYDQLMLLIEQLCCAVARDTNGHTAFVWGGTQIELATAWRRLTVQDAVREFGHVQEAARVFADPAFAAEVAILSGVSVSAVFRALFTGVPSGVLGKRAEELADDFKDPTARPALTAQMVERYVNDEERRVRAGHIGYMVFEASAEAKLVQPTFLTEFPVAVSPLARRSDRDAAFCDRFELFVGGMEVANGFSELNDPDDQRARFKAQLTARATGDTEAMAYDEDYCQALEIGMPPAAGAGIGIDRLVMLLTGQASIRDVILFPLMRPER